ncbi:MAG: tRNA (adenosine(37)-N6)-threonylcarbamoyltransferase complex dimerization subunit type 1 TsaB [Clostridioides sp.]|jgi:tRNA threonylcarbamoyl adenosine modification protein YeaZ|nr:tRNA (adenosine(37)-N6)-threonylcarbamoyltransferase complex dimerization subunit type 1 TsaB [Clostridioides sp.]
MRILGIDTSTRAASIAVMEDDKLICEFVVSDTRTHSQKLMDMIESMLKISDIDINTMEAIAVCVGPGSFTGIRIGVATAKAIAHVNSIPVIAVNSLESLANNASLSLKTVVPVLDAQKNQVYSAKYGFRKDGKCEVIDEIGIISVEDLIAEIENSSEEYLILGEALMKYADRFENLENAEVLGGSRNISNASSVCEVAAEKFSNEVDVYNCYEVKPMYLKKSQAEIQYEEKHMGEHI